MNEVAVLELDEVDSTNTEAKRCAEHGASHLTLVWAHRQTRGRGRYGRQWQSPEGNVFWSMIVRPQPNWPPGSTLSYVAALSVIEALRILIGSGADLRLKWPNDVLLSGKKVSGILLEASNSQGKTHLQTHVLDWIVVGIGVNVVDHPKEGLSYPATSLHIEGFHGLNRDLVIKKLTECFVEKLREWTIGGFSAIRDMYLSHVVGVGEPMRVRFSDDSSYDLIGTFKGLDYEGYLLVQTANGDTRRVSAGDIFFLRGGQR
jgi:BirA family transcriptional regulator, biotin operon repressor / biotin---[acetyl-CoA-carboxylase] ligase